jgi:hypothetical protein
MINQCKMASFAKGVFPQAPVETTRIKIPNNVPPFQGGLDVNRDAFRGLADSTTLPGVSRTRPPATICQPWRVGGAVRDCINKFER